MSNKIELKILKLGGKCMWSKRYLNLAKMVSSWSKDPSTKVGSVIVGEKGQILSQGYNGFPRGIEDSNERLDNREVKYKYIVHSEMNAIYNASLNGTSLKGATIYVHGLPVCSECAKGIIQVGIKKVVLAGSYMKDNWKESCILAENMLKEAGIEIVKIFD